MRMAPEGVGCDDGDPCTVLEFCHRGTCVPGGRICEAPTGPSEDEMQQGSVTSGGLNATVNDGGADAGGSQDGATVAQDGASQDAAAALPEDGASRDAGSADTTPPEPDAAGRDAAADGAPGAVVEAPAGPFEPCSPGPGCVEGWACVLADPADLASGACMPACASDLDCYDDERCQGGVCTVDAPVEADASSLGAPCISAGECPFDYHCFVPSGASAGFCTLPCGGETDETTCSSGYSPGPGAPVCAELEAGSHGCVVLCGDLVRTLGLASADPVACPGHLSCADLLDNAALEIGFSDGLGDLCFPSPVQVPPSSGAAGSTGSAPVGSSSDGGTTDSTPPMPDATSCAAFTACGEGACGIVEDGCGAPIDCGGCWYDGEVCGGTGVPNRCGTPVTGDAIGSDCFFSWECPDGYVCHTMSADAQSRGGFCTLPCDPGRPDACSASNGYSGPGVAVCQAGAAGYDGLCTILCGRELGGAGACPGHMQCGDVFDRGSFDAGLDGAHDYCVDVDADLGRAPPYAAALGQPCTATTDCPAGSFCTRDGLPTEIGFCTLPCQGPGDVITCNTDTPFAGQTVCATVDPGLRAEPGEAHACFVVCAPDGGCPSGSTCTDRDGDRLCMPSDCGGCPEGEACVEGLCRVLADNLLVNGGFETDAGAAVQGAATGWTLPPDARVVREQQALQLAYTAQAELGDGIVQSGYLPVSPGHGYVAGLLVRSVDINTLRGRGNVSAGLRWFDAQYRALADGYSPVVDGIAGEVPWTRHERVVTAPAGAAYVKVWILYNWTTGTAFVDDVYLYDSALGPWSNLVANPSFEATPLASGEPGSWITPWSSGVQLATVVPSQAGVEGAHALRWWSDGALDSALESPVVPIVPGWRHELTLRARGALLGTGCAGARVDLSWIAGGLAVRTDALPVAPGPSWQSPSLQVRAPHVATGVRVLVVAPGCTGDVWLDALALRTLGP